MFSAAVACAHDRAHGGHLPLYRQVRQLLAERIATGEYRAGDRLPSEPVLAAELGAHRLTRRRALEELAGERLLHARQGAAGSSRSGPRLQGGLVERPDHRCTITFLRLRLQEMLNA